jgi:hypothetical protein
MVVVGKRSAMRRGENARGALLALAMLGVVSTTAAAQDPRTMPPDSWLEIPGTHLRDVAPPPEFDVLRGGEGLAAVIDHWSGAALDTTRSRLIVWGGGGSGYYGNELYVFDVATLAWSRLTDPSLAASVATGPVCGDPLPDGTPAPRSTYGGLAFLEHADRLFALGGGGTCGGCGKTLPWTYHFAGEGWRSHPPIDAAPATGCGNVAVYDPAANLLYFGDQSAASIGLWSYDIDRDAWSHLAGEPTDDFYSNTGAIDTRRRQLVFAGYGTDADASGLFSYPLDESPMVREAWPWRGTTGEPIAREWGPGFDYDPSRDRFVAWIGSPDAPDAPAYILDPETRTWTVSSALGAPPPSQNGTYGRWRYVASVDAFILVTSVDGNVFFYKPPGAVVPQDGGASLDGGAIVDGGANAPLDASSSFDAPSAGRAHPHFRGSSLGGCRIAARRGGRGAAFGGCVLLAAISIALARRRA